MWRIDKGGDGSGVRLDLQAGEPGPAVEVRRTIPEAPCWKGGRLCSSTSFR